MFVYNQCGDIGVGVYRYWPKNWTYAAQTDSHCPEPTNFYLDFVISCAIIEDDFRFFLGNMIASICCRSYERNEFYLIQEKNITKVLFDRGKEIGEDAICVDKEGLALRRSNRTV